MPADLNVHDYETLDELLRAIVGPKNKSGRPVEHWAALLGLAASSLYAKGRDEGSSFTLKHLVTVVASGETAPVKWLSAAAPGLYVADLPKAEHVEALGPGLARTVKEFGEFLAETAEAIRDGRVTGGELARIKKEGLEAAALILGIVELARKLDKSRPDFQEDRHA